MILEMVAAVIIYLMRIMIKDIYIKIRDILKFHFKHRKNSKGSNLVIATNHPRRRI